MLIPPIPNEVVDLTMPDGAIVRLRRHGKPDGPRIALSHGNGLAIEAYFPFWQLLLDDFDVILFDVRNHGQNPLHGAENHRWEVFRDDFERIYQAIQERFGAARTAGAFHSLSSVASLDQALTYGARWDPHILIDPPLFPPPGHPLLAMEEKNMREMSALAHRRPVRYPSYEAFAEQLVKRSAFDLWVEGAHLLFAQSTLRPDPEGDGLILRCPREMEAHVFATNINPTLWPRGGDLSVPLKVIGADPSAEFQPEPAVLSQAFAEESGLDYAMIEGTTHFLQIEQPDQVCAVMTDFLALNGHGVRIPNRSRLRMSEDQGY